MTYHYIEQIDNGRLCKPYLVSQFNLEKSKNMPSIEEVNRDYSILESLYDIQEVEDQKVYAKMYSGRNRYVDIITYKKSRV